MTAVKLFIRSTDNDRNKTLAVWDLGIHSKEISCPGDEGSRFLQNATTRLPDHSITFKATIMFRLPKCLLSMLLIKLIVPQHPSTEVRRDIQGAEIKPHTFLNHSIWIIQFTSCLRCTLSNHPSQLIRLTDGIQTTVFRKMKITTLISLTRIEHKPHQNLSYHSLNYYQHLCKVNRLLSTLPFVTAGILFHLGGEDKLLPRWSWKYHYNCRCTSSKPMSVPNINIPT